MVLNSIANQRYLQAIENLKIARQQESLADPDHLDLAIEKTNLAMMELGLVIKSLKMGVHV